MPVARWAGCGDGQALEGSLAGGTVWSEKLPSAGERCVFSHTRPPLATAVWEGFSRTRVEGEQAEAGHAEATGWPRYTRDKQSQRSRTKCFGILSTRVLCSSQMCLEFNFLHNISAFVVKYTHTYTHNNQLASLLSGFWSLNDKPKTAICPVCQAF